MKVTKPLLVYLYVNSKNMFIFIFFTKISNTTSIAFLLREYQTLSNTPQTFLTSGLHIAFKIIYAKSYISQ